MTAFETVSDVRNVLGVAPVWDPQSARLLWADPRAPSLHRLDPASGAAECWDMPEPARAVVLRQDGTLLLALCRRIVAFDPATDKTEDLFTLPETLLRHRFNRGRCDPKGRFVVGTLQEKAKTVGGDQADGTPEESGGTLYQMDAERRIDELFGDVGIPDGLAWSPDGRTMYFADNWLDTVYAFDYAPATGRIGERRVFLRTDDHAGHPWGCAVDAEGFLWIAEFGGWRLMRHAPDGRVDRIVNLPVQNPTGCAFGGPGLDTLFVTSATWGIPATGLARQPLAGTVFALNVGVKGLTEPRYAG